MNSSETPGRNRQLDGLRGYAAVSVAFFHTITAFDYSQIARIESTNFWNIHGFYDRLSKVVFALLNGETPVVIFFVLSGAVLLKSLMANKDALPTMGYKFLVRRFLRIYPTLLVAVLICFLVLNQFVRTISANDLWLNILIVQCLVIGQSWTLNPEIVAAPCILLAFLGYFYLREAGLVLALILIWVVFYHVLPADGPPSWLRLVWYCFAVGMLIPTRIGQVVASFLPRHSWIPALVIMLVARHFIPDFYTGLYVHRTSAGILVALIYYGKAGKFGDFLERPISLFFGKISFSFYLYAALLMEIIVTPLRAYPWMVAHPLEMGLPTSVLVVLLTIPVAMISFRWIEVPSIKFGNWLARLPFRKAPNPTQLVVQPSE